MSNDSGPAVSRRRFLDRAAGHLSEGLNGLALASLLRGGAAPPLPGAAAGRRTACAAPATRRTPSSPSSRRAPVTATTCIFLQY